MENNSFRKVAAVDINMQPNLLTGLWLRKGNPHRSSTPSTGTNQRINQLDNLNKDNKQAIYDPQVRV
jgi:hypothetical protein